MTAGVHVTWDLGSKTFLCRSVFRIARFSHRKGIQVAEKTDRGTGTAGLQNTDHTRYPLHAFKDFRTHLLLSCFVELRNLWLDCTANKVLVDHIVTTQDLKTQFFHVFNNTGAGDEFTPTRFRPSMNFATLGNQPLLRDRF